MLRSSIRLAALAVMAAGAAAAQPFVSPAELAGKLGAPDLAILDIRPGSRAAPGDTYADGHIPGAVDANYRTAGWRAKVDGIVGMLPPVEVIEATIAGLGVDSDDHVVIANAGAGDYGADMGSATRVYWTFKALGHETVSILEGGMKAWREAGLPLSYDAPPVEQGDFTAELQEDMIATASDVAAAMTGDYDLFDARPAPQYRGEAKSGAVARYGALPGAVNFPITAMVDEDGSHFLPEATLAERFDRLGLAPGRTRIAYCNTGHWASVGWFMLSEVLGEDGVKLYDGSLVEWTAEPGRPVLPGAGPAVDG